MDFLRYYGSVHRHTVYPDILQRWGFTRFCCCCCLTGPYLRLSGRPGVGHQHVENQRSICMVHLVTQNTAVTRQTLAAKSHPFESNTLHLLHFEHLRNLVATHPAAVGVE